MKFDMNDFIKKIEDGKLLIEFKKEIYHKESILSSTYKFTDLCHIYVDESCEEYMVYFINKKNRSKVLKDIALEFCNELIDQEVRLQTNIQFKEIRKLIVRKAFEPIEDSPKNE